MGERELIYFRIKCEYETKGLRCYFDWNHLINSFLVPLLLVRFTTKLRQSINFIHHQSQSNDAERRVLAQGNLCFL